MPGEYDAGGLTLTGGGGSDIGTTVVSTGAAAQPARQAATNVAANARTRFS